jgi:2,3-bisphosphoglycerate-independent phosphoglycerate mutase
LKRIIFFIIDGMADDPRGDFLARSHIPNLDALARDGIVQRVYTVRGQEPESDVAIVRLFGYDTTGSGYPGRGPLEAFGAGIVGLNEPPCLAWRANFASFREADSVFRAEVVDSRVGRTLTDAHARTLCEALNRMAKQRYDPPLTIEIHPTVEHRAVVVFRNHEFRPELSNLDPFYKRLPDGTTRAVKPDHPFVQPCRPFTGDFFAAGLASDYVEACYDFLKTFRIAERVENDLHTADGILMRNAGNRIIDLRNCLTLTWAAHVGMPMERGIARAGGMRLTTFDYHPVDLDVALATKRDRAALYAHIGRNLEREIEQYQTFLNSDFEEQAVWIHSKLLDVAGHDGEIERKRRMLERLDQTVVAQIQAMVKSGEYAAVITADHATVCALKRHTQDPVPLLIAGLGCDRAEAFDEAAYMGAGLEIDAPDLFSRDGPVLSA